MVSTLPMIAEALPRVDQEIRRSEENPPSGIARLRTIVILTATLALGGKLDRQAIASAAWVEIQHDRDPAELFRLGCVLANRCAGAAEEARMAEYGTAFGSMIQNPHEDLARKAAEAVPDVDNDAAAILRELPMAYLNWASALIA